MNNTVSDNSEHPQSYFMRGLLQEGNCSLTITKVGIQDEGKWRCIAEVINDEEPDETYTIMAPLIHLHIIEYDHATGGEYI